MAQKTTLTTTRWQRCGALLGLGVLAALATGCGSGNDDGESQPAPHDIVVNLDGEVAVLDDLDASPRVVGPRPAGAEDADAYRLANPRQLASGMIVGMRDAGVVAIAPSEPGRAVLLGPAGAWFPSTDGKQLWAVTEEPADTACAGQRLPQTVTTRFTVSKYETTGRPSRTSLTLPCGLRPLADTSQGLLAVRTTGDAVGSGNGVRAKTEIVLLNAQASAAVKTIAADASVVATSNNRVIWRDDVCSKGNCTQAYDLKKRKSEQVPSCEGGDTVGVGTLDHSGRWYASDLRSNHLAILDLSRNTCRDLDISPALDSSDIEHTFGVAWSGQSLLLLDERSGDLTSINAVNSKIDKRVKPLRVVNKAQIWGAATD
ncbi:hypothetical protein [Streptomyces sp. NPDC050263]|uniref:hypothetical protein n=1 Tax=Streptomyces sp. NPDC050263 TaxID=3155037 RepID=UPI0034279CEB